MAEAIEKYYAAYNSRDERELSRLVLPEKLPEVVMNMLGMKRVHEKWDVPTSVGYSIERVTCGRLACVAELTLTVSGVIETVIDSDGY